MKVGDMLEELLFEIEYIGTLHGEKICLAI